MGRAQWRKGRHTRSGMERIGRGPGQRRPRFRPHSEFRRRGRRRQAAQRARRMAARSRRQMQSRSAANPGPPARALRRQALVLAGSLSDQGLSLSAHRSRQARREGRGFRDRRHRARVHASMASRSDSRTCPSSISVSSAASRSRGPAGARGRAPDSQISNRASFANLGSSAPRRRSRRPFIPPRSWPIPRWSWKAMTRPCISSRRNSS